MLKKGLKQVSDVHCHAHLHPYFTLMCNSTTIRMIPLPMKCRYESDMLSSYTSKWSRDVDVHCGKHHQLVSALFAASLLNTVVPWLYIRDTDQCTYTFILFAGLLGLIPSVHCCTLPETLIPFAFCAYKPGLLDSSLIQSFLLPWKMAVLVIWSLLTS